MPSDLVETFIEGLHELEQSGESPRLLQLFSDRCRLSTTATPRVFEGPKQAADFWRMWRVLFKEAHTEFTKVVESGSLVALEWMIRGTLAGGEPFSFDGVTMLEVTEEHILRFHAYFDPAALRGMPRGPKDGKQEPPGG